MASKPTFTLLLPVLEDQAVEHLLPLAAALARARSGVIHLLSVVNVPADQPLSNGVVAAQQRREVLNQLLGQSEMPVVVGVRVARSLYEGITDAVRETQADLLVLGWRGEAFSTEQLFGPSIEQLLVEPPCDLVVVKHQHTPHAPRILLPTNGGPHLQLGADIATALAGATGGSVTILVATDPHYPLDPAVLQRIRQLEQTPYVARYLERASPPLPAIIEEAATHDVAIIGATGRRFSSNLAIGTLGEVALKELPGTVIITRHKLAAIEQQAIARFEAGRDIAARVDKWFAENTFSSDEFADIERLVALKHQQGLTISLALPALNEAQTLGPLIDALKAPLYDELPLLDEIVLIDSNSTDDTRAIAAGRGVPVHIHQHILSRYGSFAGKGEALWKSLYVTQGDIVVWVDTDIHDIHPRFIYGLVGPLLREPRLQFTKGFYRRPITVGGQLVEAGGGRVTELVARPLFNLFYPELSGFIQPLSGEYAARRSALERQPFFTGYGVETGLLIDLLHDIGLDAMAQVDLQQRIHRNQELGGLSGMAFAIIQVVMQRLASRERLRLLDPINQSLQLIQYADDGGFHLDTRDIYDHERPMIRSIPEYIARQAQVEVED
jgi:nucleotide-binding universal stress UspA family protein/glycosyltransferase involved in cell wall biosynthesis